MRSSGTVAADASAWAKAIVRCGARRDRTGRSHRRHSDRAVRGVSSVKRSSARVALSAQRRGRAAGRRGAFEHESWSGARRSLARRSRRPAPAPADASSVATGMARPATGVASPQWRSSRAATAPADRLDRRQPYRATRDAGTTKAIISKGVGPDAYQHAGKSRHRHWYDLRERQGARTSLEGGAGSWMKGGRAGSVASYREGPSAHAQRDAG